MDYLIPTSVFNEGIEKIADLKEKNIVVHCHSGARSGRVQQLMLQLGYKKVVNLSGGIANYSGDTK